MKSRCLIYAGFVLLITSVWIAPLSSQGRGQRGAPAGPAPRDANGRILLSNAPGQDGLWLPVDARLSVPDVGQGRGPGGSAGVPKYPNLKYSEVPFQPWARALLDYRLDNPFEPHSRCKPSGGPRQIMTPYGIEFAEMPALNQIFIMDVGGPHTYRQIFMDGREHPKNLVPSFYGHSVGRWDGDTLVVDSIGFNETFWMDREGSPHTDRLHLIEKFTRIDSNLIKYEATIDDPGAYTAKWTGGFYLQWTPGQSLFEYVCQDNNFAGELLVGTEGIIQRDSPIVP
jgi:hypothetical protein